MGQLGHGATSTGHRCGQASRAGYARRRPEQTALYQTVADYWSSFLERMTEQGGLPKFVREEFEGYLRCGLLEYGCLSLECRSCGHSELVAFSCKRRGFCPGCLGRRMSDTAVHLVQEVLPKVPVRHWVCSFPWGVRAVLGYDKDLCREAVRAFAKELSRSLSHRAKRRFGLSSVGEALTGLVVAVQRTDGALRLNVHLHVLALDGVYLRDGGELAFQPLPTPTAQEVSDIARRTALRVHQAFDKRGRPSPWADIDGSSDSEDSDPLSLEEPGLLACYKAAAQGLAISGERAGQLRLVTGGAPEPEPGACESDEPVAEALGISVYARQVVDGRDRAQLERLCRYVMRPPLSQERLERLSDGWVELTLKSPWRDGTRAFLLSPDDLLVRLCAAVPPPWWNMVRYFGVLSSHSGHDPWKSPTGDRSEVVPAESDPRRFAPAPASGDQLELFEVQTQKRSRWGWLLRHVFRVDVETCRECGGPMRWVEAATASDAIGRLLAEHDPGKSPKGDHPGQAPLWGAVGARAPPIASATMALGQLELPFG